MTSNLKQIFLNNKKEALLINRINNQSIDEILDKTGYFLKNNIKIIHFYINELSDNDNLNIAFKLRQLCSIYEAILIINSRLDIAKIVNADGICLKKDDINIKYAKNILDKDKFFSYLIDNDNIEDINKFDYICSFDNLSDIGYKFIKLVR